MWKDRGISADGSLTGVAVTAVIYRFAAVDPDLLFVEPAGLVTVARVGLDAVVGPARPFYLPFAVLGAPTTRRCR